VETTLFLVKPDAIRDNLATQIIGELARYPELKIIGMKMIKINPTTAEKHYTKHSGRDYFPWITKELCSGSLVAIAIRGDDAVEIIRELAGATDPAKADKDSIRGKFICDSMAKSRDEKRAVYNRVHAAENPEEAKGELAIWFPELI